MDRRGNGGPSMTPLDRALRWQSVIRPFGNEDVVTLAPSERSSVHDEVRICQ